MGVWARASPADLWGKLDEAVLVQYEGSQGGELPEVGAEVNQEVLGQIELQDGLQSDHLREDTRRYR